MTQGNGPERSGDEPVVGGVEGPIESSIDDSADGENAALDPAMSTTSARPTERRRKSGVRYGPI
jgi:hypothetical protein